MIMTQTIEAVYTHGVLRPTRKLPLRDNAHVTMVFQSGDPVSRTRRALPVARRLAKVLIYDESIAE